VIPVAAEFAVVAPVNAQVRCHRAIICRNWDFTVATSCTEFFGSTFGVKFVGQVKGWIDVISLILC
jgi:hypothetical protein